MNILMFVMSILMLLSVMTYGRLETFRSFAITQSQFEYHMQHTEREYVNVQAEKKYESIIVTPQNKGDKENQERSLALAKLNLIFIVEEGERVKSPEVYQQFLVLLQTIVEQQFSEKPYFIKLAERRPEYLSELIAAIERETTEMEPKKKPNQLSSLATLDLKDQELNEVLYKLLKCEEKPTLMDLVTMQKKDVYKIRLYLAPREILLAIYGDPGFVDRIMEDRYRLYNEVRAGKTSAEATQNFQEMYQGAQPSGVNASILDFGVSKTRPPKKRSEK